MKKIFLLIIVLSLFIRFLLVLSAYHGDLNNNISWGDLLLARGTNGFYGSSDANDWPYSAPNQPPLYLYIFALTSWINKSVEDAAFWLNKNFKDFPSRFIWFWQEKGKVIAVKLPGIIADIGVSYLIFSYLSKKGKMKTALIITTLWLFNPVVIYNSTVWGQTDSTVNFFGLASVLSLLAGNLAVATLLFTLGFLYKGSLLIFIPIILVYCLKKKFTLKVYVKAIVLSLGVVFLISFPFHPYLDFPLWFVNLYKERIIPGEIGYLTANAFNFWWLINPGKVLDSTKYLFFTARVWGMLITFFLIGFISFRFYKNPKEEKIFFYLSLVAWLSFLFMTRMHERYLYPFFPYSTILVGFYPITIWVYISVSIVHLLNLYHLFWQPEIPVLIDSYNNEWFPKILSVFILFLFLSYVCLVKLSEKRKMS